MSSKKPALNTFFLTMIMLSTILSIKNWPFTAEYGFSSLFYIGLAAILFFLPSAFVAAELASGWPTQGGIFTWVKEAMGHKWGFLAVWLLWVENVVWYPTILSFIAGAIAYVFSPSLASNPTYTFLLILLIFWSATIANLFGIKISGWISSVGVLLGTLLPGGLIIALGALWFFSGKPLHIDFSLKALIPDFTHFSNFAFLAGVMLGFAGMEMPALHAKDVKNPQKDYPKAILISCTIILLFSILGTLAIAIVIPKGEINLIAGGIEAISHFLEAYGLKWSVPLISTLIALGALGGLSTWIAGPCRGLLAAGCDGDLPPLLHKTNRHDMPFVMMLSQGVIVSLLASVFLFMPSINSSFWMLIALTSELYLLMYFLMFVSAIILRYKRKEVKRSYRVPYGNVGMWVISSLGIFGTLFGMVVGFCPPAEIGITSLLFYDLFLVIGILLFCIIPFVILHFKKKSWLLPSKK